MMVENERAGRGELPAREDKGELTRASAFTPLRYLPQGGHNPHRCLTTYRSRKPHGTCAPAGRV
jgi:hypothetical protein